MVEVNASASMAAARERFLSGLDRKLAEVVDIALLLSKPGASPRTLDDLRRRLNALYASAKVFRVDGLTQRLAELVGRLEALDATSAQDCVMELTRLRRHYGSGTLTSGQTSEAVTIAAAAASVGTQSQVRVQAVGPEDGGDGSAGAGPSGAGDAAGGDSGEPGIEYLAALESRSRQAFDALRTELGRRTVTGQQRRDASQWLEEGLRRVGASLTGRDVPKHWSVRPGLTSGSRRPAASGPVGSLGGLRVIVLGQLEKLSEVPRVLRAVGVEVVTATTIAEARGALAHAPIDAFVCGIGRRSEEGLALWAQLTGCPLSEHAPGVVALSSETYRDRAIELGVRDAEFFVAKDPEAAALEVRSALERQVAPLSHLETALGRKGPVNGRLHPISPWQIILRVARLRPDAKVVLRAAHSMFELDLRQGMLMSASRTAIDGHYASGMGSLVAFLASRTGVFQVTEITAPVKAKFAGGTVSTLQEAFARLSGLVLSFELGATLAAVRAIKLDDQALQALLKFSPPERKSLIQQLAGGAPPLALLGESVDAAAVRDALRDLLRHGALLDIETPDAPISAPGSSVSTAGPAKEASALSEAAAPRVAVGSAAAEPPPPPTETAASQELPSASERTPGRDNARGAVGGVAAGAGAGATTEDTAGRNLNASDIAALSSVTAETVDTQRTGDGYGERDASSGNTDSLLPLASNRTRIAFWLLFLLAVLGGYFLYRTLQGGAGTLSSRRAPASPPAEPAVTVVETPSLASEAQRLSDRLRFGGKADLATLSEMPKQDALPEDQARLLVERPKDAADADEGSDIQVRIGDRDLGSLPLQVDLPQGRVHLVFLDKDTAFHRFMYLIGGEVHLAQAQALR